MAKTENRGGARPNSGRDKINPLEKKYPVTMHLPLRHIQDPTPYIKERNMIFRKAVAKAQERLFKKGVL